MQDGEYEMSFDLPEHLISWQAEVRNMVDEYLRPHEQSIEDTEEIPQQAIEVLQRNGLFGINTPAEYGGLGKSMLSTCLAVQELAKVNIAYYYLCGLNIHIGSKAIELYGSESQRREWLPRLAAGSVISAFALTEAEAGSDVAGIQTLARRDGTGYCLNGTKRFITNAPSAGIFTIFANVKPGSRGEGITAFLVESGTPGLRIGEHHDMCGGRGSQHASLHLEDCRIPAENLIGEEGQGLKIALSCLDAGRTVWAAYAVGVAEHVLGLAVKHLQSRKQFGRPLIDNQGLQWRLADMVAALHAARLVAYEAALRYDRDPEARRATAAMSKLTSTEMACAITDQVMQLFGGIGYSRELPIERFWRDARACRILDGTSEILRTVLARDLNRWIEPSYKITDCISH